MAQYLAPGVYVEEVPGAKPIEGVGTATGAFVGLAERGPIGVAVLVTNWTQFVETFGGYVAHGYLAYAVNQFFTEGGTRCYVVRTCHYGDITNPASATATASAIVLQDRASTPSNTLRVEAATRGSWGDDLAVIVRDDRDNTFQLAVLRRGVQQERYERLTPATAPGEINTRSALIRVADLGSTSSADARRPALSRVALKGLSLTALAGGVTAAVAVDAAAGTFRLTVQRAGAAEPAYANLTMADVERRVNAVSKLVTVAVTDPAQPPDATAAPVALPFFALAGGWEGLQGTVLQDRASTPANTLAVSAWRERVTVDIAEDSDNDGNRFRIVVKSGGTVVEDFDHLAMADVEARVNAESAYIEVNDLASATAAPANRPAARTGVAVPVGVSDADFVGDAAAKNGIHALDVVDDVNILAVPDRYGDREVAIAAYSYCQNRRDCFFVADPPLGLTPQQALDYKQGTGDYAGNAFNSSYAALYYPWISVSDPLTGGNKLVPPSGAVAGTYSYTDTARGVHKAPAGINEGYLNSAVAVERFVTGGEQELLNPAGVNVIRSFPGVGIVLWGARTVSADAEFKYVNVRRLLLFIEESIDQGTQWVVFEPNDRSLWAKVKRDVTAFLATVWQSGALFGSTPQEAFFVKVDDENNPPASRDLGRLVIDVGVAPVKPTEFVIFRVSQMTQGAKA